MPTTTDLNALREWRDLIAEIAGEQHVDGEIRLADGQLNRAVFLADADLIRDAVADTDPNAVSLASLRCIGAFSNGSRLASETPALLRSATVLADLFGAEIRRVVRAAIERDVRDFWAEREANRAAMPFDDYCRQFVAAGYSGEL